jgi:replicative DNA helicase
LIGRREKFEPGSGVHKLWLTVGGSAGHSGDWALDIDEGVMDDDFRGRRWGVSVRRASEVRGEVNEQVQAARVEREAEKTKTKTEAREREDAEAVAVLIGCLKDEPNLKATMKRIRALTGWGADKADRITARAEKVGIIRPGKVPVAMRFGDPKDYPGFQLVNDPEMVL